jgi:hypothetical protein
VKNVGRNTPFDPVPELNEVLGEPMDRLRDTLSAQRSPEFRKRQLMAEFARFQTRRAGWSSWAIGAAAAVLIAIAVGAPWSMDQRWSPETQPSENAFTPVPYTRPLAGGEWVQVVRTELNGAVLAQMGLDLLLDDGGDFDAELLIGEDGLPHAVRVITYAGFRTNEGG